MFQQLIVKCAQPLPSVAKVGRIDIKDRDILALEAEIYVLKIPQRADKQARGDQQRQGQGNLVCDQYFRNPRPVRWSG